MKILIASGIYPPDIGSAAQYARNLYEVWKNETDGNGQAKNDVKVAAFRWERAFPPFIRHFLFFLKMIRKGWKADLILVLDTWSAAVPAMLACKLMGKKYILRTGGDQLWESYVERTGNMVLLRDFYQKASTENLLSFKEKLIFKWSGNALRNASRVIFSTEWQKKIFESVYRLKSDKCRIVEDFWGPRDFLDTVTVAGEKSENLSDSGTKVFVGGSRSMKWKNNDLLRKAFERAKDRIRERNLENFGELELDMGKSMYDLFFEKIRRSYGVILVSLGDPSPAVILDAVRAGVPFIITKENGIAARLGNAAIQVDPLNEEEIAQKILYLADPKNHAQKTKEVRSIAFTHTWKQIAGEIIDIWKNQK
jgi:glycosyltransferase involved in cell wall biosynthesis